MHAAVQCQWIWTRYLNDMMIFHQSAHLFVSNLAPKSIFVVVMDGITLGHPCCAEHNCKIPLTSSRDRYCPKHASKNAECVVDSCGRSVRDGKHTCDNPVHQEVEHINCEHGQSRFQLQERMKQLQVAHPNDGAAEERNLYEVVDEEDDELFEDDEQGNVTATEGPASENTAMPKKRVRARFGRRHTHNEQILVAPCGMILAHETFYGAEAIGTCAVRSADSVEVSIIIFHYDVTPGIHQANLSNQWRNAKSFFF